MFPAATMSSLWNAWLCSSFLRQKIAYMYAINIEDYQHNNNYQIYLMFIEVTEVTDY